MVPRVILVLCPWWNMLVPTVMPVVCTGAFAAAAGIAAPTIAEPAIPSARIAGIIKTRPMRMTPPPQLPGAWQGAVAPAGEAFRGYL